MLQSLRDFRWIDGIEGASAPNQEDALFKYNNLSLGASPHYWFLQWGGLYKAISSYEPTLIEGLKPSADSVLAGNFDGGIGIGPSRVGDVTTFAGYTYRQRWFTSEDRIGGYFEDLFDFKYFPLRSDLMERRHELYADFRKQLHPLIFTGLFTRFEIRRVGSSLLPSGENDDLNKVSDISQTQLMIPWLGYSVNPNFRNLLYLYWRKELNSSSPEFSNKTYEFTLSGPVFSLGLSSEWDLPEHLVNLSAEVFQYEFIYNDPWLDYTRVGMILSAQHEFLPRWFVQGLFGIYQDKYQLPRIKRNRCQDAPSRTGGDDSAPSVCSREDAGLLYSATIYWNYTQFQRFSFQFEQVENQNAQQKEYQTSSQNIKFNFTLAFPSVKRTTRFVDRFADSAFTKENH
jgi:hypothetical protein